MLSLYLVSPQWTPPPSNLLPFASKRVFHHTHSLLLHSLSFIFPGESSLHKTKCLHSHGCQIRPSSATHVIGVTDQLMYTFLGDLFSPCKNTVLTNRPFKETYHFVNSSIKKLMFKLVFIENILIKSFLNFCIWEIQLCKKYFNTRLLT